MALVDGGGDDREEDVRGVHRMRVEMGEQVDHGQLNDAAGKKGFMEWPDDTKLP